MNEKTCKNCKYLDFRHRISYQDSWTNYYCTKNGFNSLEMLEKCPLIRFDLKTNDFGYYFFDSFLNKILTLKEVLEKLNEVK